MAWRQSWKLIGDLRQLSHDMIAMPLDKAIKADHPRILDEAARRIQDLEEAAQEAFSALVGSHAADDSVQGKARARLKELMVIESR